MFPKNQALSGKKVAVLSILMPAGKPGTPTVSAEMRQVVGILFTFVRTSSVARNLAKRKTPGVVFDAGSLGCRKVTVASWR
jgi:hypothetical protein